MSLTLSNYKFLEKLKLSGNYNDDYDYDYSKLEIKRNNVVVNFKITYITKFLHYTINIS